MRPRSLFQRLLNSQLIRSPAMTRSLLPPLRTRRHHRGVGSRPRPEPEDLTPATRRTVAAIGALLVSFAAAASAAGRPGLSACAPAPAE